MNYYPAANGWTRMWTNWDPAVLKSDFARIHDLGANAVRISVFPNTFGWPGISKVMATRFADTLNIAASEGLGVQLTMFDWWDLYSDIGQSQAWLRSFLHPYASDPEIQLVEIKNEVDPADPAAVAWVRALLPTLRTVMPRTPITVSVSGAEGPRGYVQLRRELGDVPLDVADVHFYGNEGTAYNWMLAAKRAAGSLPLFVGEIGFSVAGNGPVAGDSASEAADLQQAHWYSVVFAAARAAGVSTPAPWTLYDFQPGAIPNQPGTTGGLNPRNYYYGLYSDTGQWQPAVAVVKQAFAQDSRTSSISNLGFAARISNLSMSLGGADSMMDWTPYLTGQGRLAYAPDVGYSAPGSVLLSATRLSQAGAPRFYLVPANPAIPGQLWNVSVWARGIDVTGKAQLDLSWFDSSGSYVGGTISRPLPHGDPSWTKLAVHSRVPAGATSAELSLMSSGIAGSVWYSDVHIKVTA
jgi:hypothetical protein